VRSDGSYLSASDLRVHAGLGAESRVSRVVVQWPDGLQERFDAVPADTITTLRRGTGRAETARR
jgi:hypothetical protein